MSYVVMVLLVTKVKKIIFASQTTQKVTQQVPLELASLQQTQKLKIRILMTNVS